MRFEKHPANRLIIANAPEGAGLMLALASQNDKVVVPEREMSSVLMARGMIERLDLESPSHTAIASLPAYSPTPTGRQLPCAQLIIPGIHSDQVTNYAWSRGRLLIADKRSNHLDLLTIHDTTKREVATKQAARSIARALLSLVPGSQGLAIEFGDRKVVTHNFGQLVQVVDPIIASGGVPSVGVVPNMRDTGKLSETQVFITDQADTDILLSSLKRTEGGICSDIGFQNFVASDTLKTACNWLREKGFRGYTTITLATTDDSSQMVRAVRPYWTAAMAATFMAAKVAQRDHKEMTWSMAQQPVSSRHSTTESIARLLVEKDCLLSPAAKKGIVPLSLPIPSRKTLCYVAFGDTGEEVQTVVSDMKSWFG